MTQEDFRQLFSTGFLLLDGATGTHLQASGMPAGVCPETWILDNPAVLQDLQRSYYSAGSQIVYAFTFGANRPKLLSHGLKADNVNEINRKLAGLSIAVRDEFRQQHPDRLALVAGDLAPTGRFLFPAGDMSFSELIDIYREQVRAQLEADVDLFVVETMMDLAEARAAVMAVRAECSLPVIVSMTFEENGRTLAGNTPLVCLLSLTGLGIDAFGINCSFGPEKLGQLIEPLISISPVPLLLKPNAGLPCLVDGHTVFPMNPESFAHAIKPLAAQGIRLFGGCCGTGPEHLQQLSDSLLSIKPAASQLKLPNIGLPAMICSARRTWQVENPASLPLVECSDPDSLIDDVYEVVDDDPPAICLDLDAAAADEDSLDLLAEAFQQMQLMIQLPLVLRSENAVLLEKLLEIYNGRAGIITSQSIREFGAVRI